jgi:D-amino-acid dehydrogenase
MSRVVVIGGGVIGLSTAYHAARHGHSVVILERGEPGMACSAGNMGWIVPSMSDPLPAPGVPSESLKWMLKRDSPLYIDPRFALTSPGWLWRFWRHCNPRDYARGLAAVAALNQRTFELYDQLEADGVRFEMRREGLLFAFLTANGLESTIASFARLTALGLSPVRRMSRDEVIAMEPALSPRVHGGAWVTEEGYVRPETLCAGLVVRLRELGCEIRSGVEVTGAARNGAGRLVAVRTTAGEVAGDGFVIAAGAWSGRLARHFGFSLPVEAGKGYSVTITEPTARVSRPLYLHEPHVGLSPYRGALRIGGTMELSGLNTRLVPARIAAIRRAAAAYVPDCQRGGAQVEWTGMRPLTPDGLPAIGRAPGWDNLYLATGHAMLGVTLAAVTGLAVAELLTRGTSSFDLSPFDPGRWGRRRTGH